MEIIRMNLYYNTIMFTLKMSYQLFKNFSIKRLKLFLFLSLCAILTFITTLVFFSKLTYEQTLNFVILAIAVIVFTNRHYLAQITLLVIELLYANFSMFHILPILYFFTVISLSVLLVPNLSFIYFSFFVFIIWQANKKYKPLKKCISSSQTNILFSFINFIVAFVISTFKLIFLCFQLFVEGLKNVKGIIFLVRVCIIDFSLKLAYYTFVRISFVVSIKLILIYYGNDLLTTMFLFFTSEELSELVELLDSFPFFDKKCCYCEGEESSDCSDDIFIKNRLTDITSFLSSSEEESLADAVDSSSEINLSDREDSFVPLIDPNESWQVSDGYCQLMAPIIYSDDFSAESSETCSIMSSLGSGRGEVEMEDQNLKVQIENIDLLNCVWPMYRKPCEEVLTAGGAYGKTESSVADIRENSSYHKSDWQTKTHSMLPWFSETFHNEYYNDPYGDGISALGSVDSQDTKQSADSFVREPHVNVPFENVAKRFANCEWFWKYIRLELEWYWPQVGSVYDNNKIIYFAQKSDLNFWTKTDSFQVDLNASPLEMLNWFKWVSETNGWYAVSGSNPGAMSLSCWYQRLFHELARLCQQKNNSLVYFPAERIPSESENYVFSTNMGNSDVVVFYGRIAILEDRIIILPSWWNDGSIEWPQRPSFLRESHHVGGFSTNLRFQSNGCETLSTINENERANCINNGKCPMIGLEISFVPRSIEALGHSFQSSTHYDPWPLFFHDPNWVLPTDCCHESFVKNVLRGGVFLPSDSDLPQPNEKSYKW